MFQLISHSGRAERDPNPDLIAVYLMASKPNGTPYLGVTSDLIQRGLEHREGRFDGFAKKYGCRTLVWWEQHYEINNAISREKRIKEWRRKWKLDLIETANPMWRDLYDDFLLPRAPIDVVGDEEAAQGSGSAFGRPE